MTSEAIYLDCHASTPVDPRVLERMTPYFTRAYGNPASRNHRFGWEARDAVEQARHEVAAAIGAGAKDVIFTSGATEANNLAIKGVAVASGFSRTGADVASGFSRTGADVAPGFSRTGADVASGFSRTGADVASGFSRTRADVASGFSRTRDHVVTVATEHKSVLESCRSLERQGWRVTVLPVKADGLVDLDTFDRAVTDRTMLVSVMAANNEIGVLQPIRAMADIAHARGAVMHTDAVQAVGKVPFDVEQLDVDLASITAHKMYGPKGAGALYVRRRPARARLAPLFDGGGHERGLRAGTLNVPGLVGLGAAASLAAAEGEAEAARVSALRDRLRAGLERRVPGVRVNGDGVPRLPGNLNVSFGGVDGEALLVALDDVAVSSGAACTKTEPSHVLTALGLDTDLALASLRFGLGRWTSERDVDYAAEKVAGVVNRLRQLAPV